MRTDHNNLIITLKTCDGVSYIWYIYITITIIIIYDYDRLRKHARNEVDAYIVAAAQQHCYAINTHQDRRVYTYRTITSGHVIDCRMLSERVDNNNNNICIGGIGIFAYVGPSWFFRKRRQHLSVAGLQCLKQNYFNRETWGFF